MRLGALAVLCAAACAAPAPGPRAAPGTAAPEPPPKIAVEPGAPPWTRLGAPDQGGSFGPSILAPAGTGDEVVARVGSREVRKSDVYDRMLDNDQRGARLWVELLVLDLVVADFARQFGVVVTDDEVEQLAADEEAMLRTQVEVEFDGARSFEDYLGAEFGLGPEAYRRLLRVDVARTRYRGLVMRYVAMREERAEVRLIVHPDPAVLEDARQKILAGADVAALARQLSEDGTRSDGGRLGPFGRAFRHPIAQVAFELEPGAVSEVTTFDDRGTERAALVYCLQRIPARDVPFADVRDELILGLQERAVTPFEQSAFLAQYCRPTTTLDTAPGDR